MRRRPRFERAEAYDRGVEQGRAAARAEAGLEIARLQGEVIRAQEAAQRWFSQALAQTDAQRQRVAELSGDCSLGTHPLWDIPDGSLLTYKFTEGGAVWIEIVEPEPTGRFVIDMGVR